MDGDNPNDRPGNSAYQDMNVLLSDVYGEDWDIEFEPDEDDEYPLEFLQPTIGSLYKATANEQDDITSSTITNHWSHTASCSNAIATGITNLVPPNQEFNDDENDEYTLESLQPTIGSLYKATTNKQDGFTSSTRTNHWSHTASGSGDMVTGITNTVPPNQLSGNSALGKFQPKPEPILQNQQYWSSHSMQSPAFTSPTQCPGIMQSHISPQTQDLQIDLMDYIPETTRFQTDRAAILLPQELPSSKIIAHTYVHSAETQHHSHHQQHVSEQPVLRSPLPLPHNTSMTLQNSQSFMIPEERKQSSRKSLVHHPTESCPVQMISYEKMENLVKTFWTRSHALDLTKPEIIMLFNKLSGKKLALIRIRQFLNFSVFFENMCHMKYVLEILLDRIQNSRTTTSSLRNSEMDGHLSNNRPHSTTGGNTDNQMSHECSGVSVKNVNHVDECGNKYEVPEQSLISTVSSHCNVMSKMQIVSSSTTRKKHVGNIGVDFNPKGTVSNLYTAMRRLIDQPAGQNSERISLKEMQRFVNDFTKKREGLGLTQTDILSKLREMCGRKILRNCMWQFESFNVFVGEVCKLKPQLEHWMGNDHISETDLWNVKRCQPLLKDYFELNQNPTADMVDHLSKKLNLDKDLLMFWFDKSRQIYEWNHNPSA